MFSKHPCAVFGAGVLFCLQKSNIHRRRHHGRERLQLGKSRIPQNVPSYLLARHGAGDLPPVPRARSSPSAPRSKRASITTSTAEQHLLSRRLLKPSRRKCARSCKEKLKLERFELPRAEAVAAHGKGRAALQGRADQRSAGGRRHFLLPPGRVHRPVRRSASMMSTGRIKGNGIKITTVTGAYWRGDSKQQDAPALLRHCASRSKDELDAYLARIEEAKKRDHRKLGKELGLFTLHGRRPRLPVLPAEGHGAAQHAASTTGVEVHKRYGYVEISTPIILNRALWERSGHWDHYKENMYTTVIDGEDYAIKPMNCPGGMLVYKSRAALLPRSAAARGRAGPCSPPRAVRRAARPVPCPLLHAGRRAHLHDPGADEGRDQERCHVCSTRSTPCSA